MIKRSLNIFIASILILSVSIITNTLKPKDVSANVGPIEIGFKPNDMAIDKNKTVVYMTKLDSNTLYAVDYVTGKISTLELPYPAERLEEFGGKLYITQQKQVHDRYNFGTQEGGIAEVDLSSFKLIRVIDVKIDPFDLAIDKKGIIHISSGSDQHGKTVQYFLDTNVELKTEGRASIYDKSYIVITNETSKLYSISMDELYPPIEAFELRNNQFAASYSSRIYIPTKKGLLKLSPDERYLYTQNGKVLELSLVQSGDMKLSYDYKKEYLDYAFDSFNNLTFAANINGGIDVYAYKSNQYLYSIEKNITAEKMIYKNGLIVAYSMKDGKYYITYLTGIDKDAPITPTVDPVKVTDLVIKGNSSPNVKVYASVSSKKIGTAYASKDGNFMLRIPKQKVGTKISIIAEDSSGNKSKPKIIGVVDKIYPVVPIKSNEFRESIKLGFKPNDLAVDSKRPIVYMTKIGNKTLYAVNYETGLIKTLELPYPAERLEIYGDKLYVTQHKQSHIIYKTDSQEGGFSEVNLSTFTVARYIELHTDPFDLTINKDGKMYISSGKRKNDLGNNMVKVFVYSIPENKLIEINGTPELDEESLLISDPISSRIYAQSTIYTTTQFEKIDVSNEQWVPSSSHEINDRSITVAKISPDGLSVFSSGGNVFDLSTDKMMLKYNLENEYNDFTFDSVNKLVFGANQEGGIDIFPLDGNNRLSTLERDITAENLIYKNGLITVYKDTLENYYLMYFKIGDKNKPRLGKINEITNTQNIIHGIASPYATINVLSNSKVIGVTKAAVNGKFSLTILKQKAGTAIKIYSIDKDNVQSNAQILTVKDRIPPMNPVVYTLTTKSTTIKGKAEIASTVYAYSGKSFINKGIVNSKGNFSLAMNKQKKGTILRIYAVDKAKNKSKESIVKIK